MKFGLNRGNVLFLILLAVALFAALSYAVTQSSRSGGNDISDEQAAIQAAEIIQWATSVEVAVQRLRLARSLKDNELDFYTTERTMRDGQVFTYDNFDCSEVSCQVFHPDGGGVSFQTFESAAIEQPTNTMRHGHSEVLIVNVAGVGSSLNDVALNVLYLKAAVCRAINKKLGLGADDNYTEDGGTFVGYHSDVSSKLNTRGVRAFGTLHPELFSKRAFCVLFNGGSVGIYYHVLIPR